MAHHPVVTLLVGFLLMMSLSPILSAHETEGVFLFYEHPGVNSDTQSMRTPPMGAAHAISLNIDLSTELSAEQASQIKQLGAWLTADGISHNAQVLIRTIQDARIHGLNPETYQLSSILKTVDTLSELDEKLLSADQQDANALSLRDLRYKINELLDTNFIKLSEHLGQGVVKGRKIQRRYYRDAPRINAFNLLVSISNAELSVAEALRQVMPSHPYYAGLKTTMRNLLTERSTQVQRTTVASDNDAQLISEAADKQTIRERLLETGDLTMEAYLASDPDAQLLRALRAFQTRHGLIASSFADSRTRAQLNRTVEQDIEAVSLSLERWRWMPRDLGERHVFINIPDYRVKVIENGATTLSMVAVVGKYKHQTPSFTRNMSYIEFNPTWTVPAKISNKELIPKERRRPGYLASRNFAFLKRVNNRLVRVPTSSVTRKDFNAASFPYILQQQPGPNNALGRMKFMMPNQYAIYLHDTQAKKHFTLNDRAYSHGCIRLADPDAFAQKLMSDDGYSQRKIDRTLRSKRTHHVRLREPLPTHLLYLTTWVDENSKLQIRPDIYRNDDALLDALRKAGTLLSEKTNFSASGDNDE